MPTQAERDKTIKLAKTMYRQIVEQAIYEGANAAKEAFLEEIQALSPQGKRELHEIWQRQESPEDQTALNALLEEAKKGKEQQ